MLSTDYTGAPSPEAESSLALDATGHWVTPRDFALFTADFSRDGTDLLIRSVDGTALRLPDYFISDTYTTVQSHEGASLSGSVVARLAGPLFPGQYAQAGGVNLEDAIGQVETLTGAAFVQRTDGTTVELDIGIKVFQGDVVRTELGGTLGITFADGTIFTLASGSRMVLDELIYDPESTQNSGVFSLVEGSFVFIAGQAAPTGGIEINTPSATMGIRGTTVMVDIQTANGVSTVEVSLSPDFDGGSGSIELFDLEGNRIATITSTDEKWIISPPSTDIPPIRLEKSEVDAGEDAPLLSQAFAALQTALARVAQGETFVELPVSETEGEEDGEETGDEGEGDPPAVPPLDEVGDDGEPGESGADDSELNNEDDPLPEGDDAPPEDDAELETESPTTDTASAGNGAPQVTVTTVQSVEDTPFSGNLGVTDNNGDAVSVALTQGAGNGQVVLFEDGTFTYTPNANFEGVDSFVVTATDTDGASTESEITVVVDGVNDAPVVSASLSQGTTLELGVGSETDGPAFGAIGYSDVDEGATPAVWTIAPSPENTTALGTISINAATGAWQYDLDQSAADPLAEGEQVIETFIATVTDALGATDSSTVQVTVTGSNDGPVITSEEAQGSLSEDIFGFAPETEEGGEFESVEGEEEEGPATGSVSGTLSYVDVDQGDTPGQWSVAANAENTTVFGDITIDPNTGFWVYTLNQLAADVLGNGETATEVFSATVTDEFGATASQSITITITGFNDAPTIEFSIEDIEATVFEDGYDGPAEGGEGEFLRFAAADLSDADATGTLRYVDADGLPGAAAAWSITPDGPSFGTMSIDAETGVWHYFLDQDAAQGLAEGEERIETFTATVTDSLGAFSSQVITITLIGSNDEASVIAAPQDLVGEVEEGGVSIASGTLTFIDADAAPGDVAIWTISADGTSRGTMVIDPVTGEWAYTLDEGLANDLGQGAQVTETYTATLTDVQGAEALQTIVITITGENDAPQIASAVLDGTVREAGTGDVGIPSISGTITAVDPDLDGTTPVWQIAADPSNTTALGLMMIDGLSGEWTYILNQTAADGLTTGDAVIERFTATVQDAFGADQDVTVEITIEGTGDAPVLSSTTRTLTEETTSVVVDLGTLATDVDDGQDGSTLNYALLNAPSAGSARIEGTELIFEPGGAFDGLVEGETAVVTLNFSATDADGLSVTSSVTLTVIGTNGAPVFSDGTAALTEGTPGIDINLANLADDPDAGEDGTTLAYSIAGAPALGSASISGSTLTFTPGTAFDDLAEGATRQVLIDLVAADADAETATATVTVTVTGTNNTPEISATSVTTGSVEEPVGVTPGLPVVATGMLAYTDPDATTPTSGIWSIAPGISALGQMAIDPSIGQWIYQLDQAAAQNLNAGDIRTETFTATITDELGATATQDIVITITGTNDAPVLGTASRTLSEDTPSTTFDLTALASDIDSADSDATLAFSIVGQPGSGRAEIDATGTTLTFFTDGDFEDLAVGDTADVTIGVEVRDTSGATDVATLTVTVTGTNDGPTITSSTAEATGAVIEAGEGELFPAVLNTTPGATGTLSYDDPDETAATPGTWSVGTITADYGALTIDAGTGEWRYFLDETLADVLREGESVTEQFTATITDAQGATAQQLIEVTITGTNDAPVFDAVTSVVTGNHTEGGTTTLSGQLAADDPDSFVVGPVWTIVPSLGTTPTYGTMSISADGQWSYDVDEAAVAALGPGPVVTESYTAIVTDEFGQSDTISVDINITGTNSSPEIIADVGEISRSLVEPGDGVVGTTSASGQLSYSDVDEGTTSGLWSITPNGDTTYGNVVIDPVSGQWTYTLDPAKTDGLNAGQEVTETFDAVYTDAFGAASDPQALQVTITGSNDAPTLTAQVVGTDQNTTTQINLVDFAGDVDAQHAPGDLTFSFTNPITTGTASITNGVLSFDPAGDFDTLADGETTDVALNITVTDPLGATSTSTVTITVTGTNDGPVIDSAPSEAVGTATEEGEGEFFPEMDMGDPDATGTLSYFDVDETPTTPGTWTVAPVAPNFGTMQIDAATGEWSYFLNQTTADSLREGATVDDVFTATVTDAGGLVAQQTITITITGTNDAPDILEARSDTQAGHTEGGNTTLTGLLEASDPDDFVNAPTWSVFQINGAGPAYGTMSIDGDGRWIYEVDPDAVATLPLGATPSEIYRAEITDEFGQSDTIDITINFVGTNTGPVMGANVGEVSRALTEPGFNEPGNLTATGQLSYSDEDEGETSGVWSITPNGDTTYGNVVIDPVSGQWTYTLDPAKTDSLNDGQEVTETFDAVYTDAFGAATAPQALLVTITGSNDAPTLTAQVAGTDPGGLVEIELAEFADDVDAEHDPQSLSFSITSPVTSGTANIVEGNLVFDPAGDFDYLGEGASEVVVINITVADPLGATSTSTVTVTVTGTNSAPEVVIGAPSTTTIDFDSGTNVVAVGTGSQNSGTYTQDGFTAAWTMDHYSYNYIEGVEVVVPGEAVVPLQNIDGDPDLEFGVLDTEHETDQTYRDGYFNLTADDGSLISIGGFDIINDDGAVEEGGGVVLYGYRGDLFIEASNPDDGANIWNLDIFNNATSTSVLVNPSASYQDVLDALVDLQSLNVQTRSLDFGIQGSIGTGIGIDNILVTPQGSFDVSKTVAETEDALATSGSFDVQDSNLSDTVNVTGVSLLASGALGALAANDDPALLAMFSTNANPIIGDAATTGTVEWSFVAGTDAFDDLSQGETLVLEYTVEISDDAAPSGSVTQVVTVTVQGTNDRPTLLTGGAEADEGGAAIDLDLTTLGGDVDGDDDALSLTYSISGAPGEGSATILDGILTFDPGTDFQDLTGGETRIVTVEITATDTHGATTVNDMTITVAGTNSAPEITIPVQETGDLDIIWGKSTNNGTSVSINDGLANFTDGQELSATPRWVDVELGDLDGDGDLDIVAPRGSSSIDILLNNGGGVFSFNGQINLAVGPNMAVDLGDLDGDGDLDAYVVRQSGVADAILINNGSGIFALNAQSITVGSTADVALGDIDGDGDLDAVRARLSDSNTIAFNDGLGNFTGDSQLLGSFNTNGVALADVDGDGDLDAVFANGNYAVSEGNRVYLNDGSGTFTDTGQSLGTNISTSVALGDVDGDGDVDAVFANTGLEGGSNTLYLNNGSGVFSITEVELGESESNAIALADLNDDGHLDVVVGNASGTNQLFLNDGGGDFSNAGATVPGDGTFGIAIGDVDGDAPPLIGARLTEFAGMRGSVVNQVATGTIDFVDPDLTDIGHTLTINGVQATGQTSGLGTNLELLGYFDTSLAKPVGVADGQITWSFAAHDRDFDYLVEGTTVTLTYDLEIDDLDGGTAETSVEIIIVGTNDTPLFASGRPFEIHNEDSPIFTIDLLEDAIDVDEGETATLQIENLVGLVDGITFNGQIVTVDPGAAAFQPLSQGEVRTLGLNFDIVDTSGGFVGESAVIQIIGANDAAVITGDISGSITEDSEPGSVTGDLDYTDVDDTDDAWLASGSSSSTTTTTTSSSSTTTTTGSSIASDLGYGTVQIGTDGAWVYQLDNSNAVVEALGLDQSTIDSFTATTTDGTTQTVTITINGVNDEAEITGDTAGTITEDAAPNTVTGDLDHTDVDANNADDAWDATVVPVALAYGSYTNAATGVWTYTLDNANTDVNALNVGDTLTDSFTMSTSDGTTETVTVTISGANDVPIVTPATAAITLTEFAQDTDGPAWTPFGGHHYQYVAAPLSWSDARDAANGIGGYLANVTSAGENAFLLGLSPGGAVGWLGGSDAAVEGEWRWVDGPEAGAQFWQGTATGTAVGGAYTNWDSPLQPDGGPENALHMFGGGTWNDIVDDPSQIMGSYIEYNGPGFASGSLAGNATDPESGAMTFALTSATAGLTINPDGTWTFDQANAAYDSIAGGVEDDIIATFSVTDDQSAVTTGTLTLGLTGIDNPAVISGDTSGSIAENAIGAAIGDLNSTDADSNHANDEWDVQALGTASDNGYGTFGINSAGQWTFLVNNAHATVNALNVGDQLTDTFTVQTTAGDTQVVTVTIDGANDAPTVSGSSANTELDVIEAGATTAGVASASGQLTYVDVDEGATFGAWSISPSGPTTYGSVSINTTTGEWTYVLDQTKADTLSEGETVTETFQATYTDAQSAASAPLDVQVTITGSNDAPVATAATQNITLEAVSLPAGGGWSAFDGNFYKFVPGSFGWAAASADAAAQGGHLATVTSAAENAHIHTLNGGAVGWLGATDVAVEGEWRWVEGPEAGAQFWQGATGGSVENGFFASWDPGQPGSSAEDYLHSFGGGTWNDLPDTGALNELMGYFLEYSGGQSFGTIAADASDPDADDLIFELAAPVAGLTLLHDGSLIFDNDHSAYDSLGASETTDVIATYRVTDGDGSTDTATLTLTLAGVNDAAVISGDTSGAVTEDGAATETGNLTYTDVDNDNPDNTWTVVGAGAATTNGYGTFEMAANGDWTYTLDNANATVNGLIGGAMLQDSFIVTAQDGTTQTVTIDITGANDKPVIVNNAALTLNVTETGVDTVGILTDSATMTVIDPDMTTGGTWSFQSVTTNFFASVSHSPLDGSWSYTLNDGAFVVDRLGEGQTGEDYFRRTYTDEFGLASDTVDMTVIVTGSNDAASFSNPGVIVGTVTEDLGDDSIGGDAHHTDIDLNNANDLWQADTGTTTYGNYSVTTGGFWTYTLDDTTPALDALDSGQTTNDSFTILTEDGTEQTINITINGNTDATPVVANDDSGFIENIGVLVLGLDDTRVTETGNQLNGAMDDRFNFTVSILNLSTAPAYSAPQWNALFNSVDVVMLGGYTPTDEGYFNTAIGLERLEAWYQSGGNIVTTGLIHEHLLNTTGATQTLLDTITPVAIPSATYLSGTQVEITGVHPITDDITDFTLVQPGAVNGWSGTEFLDAGAVKYGQFDGNSGSTIIAAKEATGAGEGNLAFVGGAYLFDGLTAAQAAELRSGNPDYLLEQALAWAAGVNKVDVNENEPFIFTADSLLANDVDPNAMATITSVQTFSDKGATVTLFGGDVLYNPITSFSLNNLDDGETDTDTFTYTISDGVTTDTATVTVTVNGLTDMDLPPVVSSTEMNGFASGDSSFYRFGLRITDDDQGSGMSHLLSDAGGPMNAPAGISFSATFVDFTFTSAAETTYSDDFGIYAYEADGQSIFVNVGYSVDSDGDLRFFYSEFAAADGGPVLEIAYDDSVADGENLGGDGLLVDLSGIDALAPTVLADTAVLDLRNGQENDLTLTAADLLNLITGNDGVENEFIWIKVDSYDNVLLQDDGLTPGSEGWKAESQVGNPNIYDITDTGGFGAFATNFATIHIDDGSVIT